jgi:hypothetical protein
LFIGNHGGGSVNPRFRYLAIRSNKYYPNVN